MLAVCDTNLTKIHKLAFQTSNVTGRHRGAGYRALSLKWMTHTRVSSLRRTSHVAISFHRRVWYRALSVLCACYACIWRLAIILIP